MIKVCWHLVFWCTSCRSFVNNVWYIKILSPEDIQKMGEQAIESLGPSSGQRLNNNTGAESHDIASGLGSLEYWDNNNFKNVFSFRVKDDYYMFVTSTCLNTNMIPNMLCINVCSTFTIIIIIIICTRIVEFFINKKKEEVRNLGQTFVPVCNLCTES